MKVAQRVTEGSVSSDDLAALSALDPQLLIVFGDVEHFKQPNLVETLREAFPGAVIAGCSTAGEICSDGVFNGRVVLTAVRFEATLVRSAVAELADGPDSIDAGERLARELPLDGLSHVLLFGPGVHVNGSALIDGIRRILPAVVSVSGGLAGDSGAFVETQTISSTGVSPRAVVAVGLYGDKLVHGHGSFHGWMPFGPLRRVTRAEGNLLYEIDGEPALSVYKRYLGDYAHELPASGLLFPFEMVGQASGNHRLIRTILGIDEEHGMLVLAGDVEQGGTVRLMHASTDSLVSGAQAAAEGALGEGDGDSLAILVSCVGRKLVMGARVDEEVEAVTDVLGKHATLAGFYSYGEISPVAEGIDCRLHNQTMTITRLSERA